MAAVVWFTVGLALWHFTVFVPDRFWGGIVHLASGRGIGDTDIGTAFVAVPGALIGLAAIYALGVRRERLAGIE